MGDRLVFVLAGLQVLLFSAASPLGTEPAPPIDLSDPLLCLPRFLQSSKASRWHTLPLCGGHTNSTAQPNKMWTQPPFALFPMEDYSHRLLNRIVQEAHDGSIVEAWWWYLPTTDYAAAPHFSDDPSDKKDTRRPISRSYHSPFVGKSLNDVVQWIKRKPKDVELDSHHFGLLDKQAGKSGKVAVCKIGYKYLKGNKVTCMLWKTRTSTLILEGLEFGDWEDMLSGNIGEYTPDI